MESSIDHEDLLDALATLYGNRSRPYAYAILAQWNGLLGEIDEILDRDRDDRSALIQLTNCSKLPEAAMDVLRLELDPGKVEPYFDRLKCREAMRMIRSQLVTETYGAAPDDRHRGDYGLD